MITIKNGKKAFGQTVILENINISIKSPGVYALVGESGCGKTTLLHMIAGFDTLSEGSICAETTPAFIFQNYELIEDLTVKENILLHHRMFTKKEETFIHELGIDSFLNSYPNELSGGQRQRVGIARALLSNPHLILCDEPTESLDIENKIVVMNLLKHLSKQAVVVIVTHDQNMIEDYADAIYKIEHKTASLVQTFDGKDPVAEIEKTAHELNVRWTLHRILLRKSLLFTIAFALLLGLWCSMYAFQQKLFMIPTTTNVVNKDVLYIKTDDSENASSTLGISMKRFEPILDFEHIKIDNKEYKSNIFPYQSTELSIEGSLPEGNQVLINQNTKQQMNLRIGDEITLVYYLASMQYEYRALVSGVVVEPDADSLNLYYDRVAMLEYLKDIYVLSGQSQYNYLIYNGNFFQATVSYASVPNYMEEVKTQKNIRVFNPLYEQRKVLYEQNKVYQLLYQAVLIIFLIGMGLFMILFVMKEAKYQQKNASILVAAQASFKSVKRLYLWEKVCLFYPIVIVGLACILGFLFWQFNDVLTKTHALILGGVIASFFVIYLVAIVLCLQQWKNRNISITMKQE